MDDKRGYRKLDDDNGRCEGAFEELSADHVVSHFEYGKKDTTGEGYSEIEREVEEKWQ